MIAMSRVVRLAVLAAIAAGAMLGIAWVEDGHSDESFIPLYQAQNNRLTMGPAGVTVYLQWTNLYAADTANVLSLALAYGDSAGQNYTFSDSLNALLASGTAFPRMYICRTLDVTVSDITDSTDAGIDTCEIVITGTNMLGEAITETYGVSDSTAATIAGTKAFRSIASIFIPMMGDSGAAVSVGLGDNVGLPFTMPLNGVTNCWYGGTAVPMGGGSGVGKMETGTAVVSFDEAAIELNTLAVTDHPPDGVLDYEAIVHLPPGRTDLR